MPDHDNRGTVSLWKNDSKNGKAPIMKGYLFAHRAIEEGEQIEVSLWKNESDNPKAPLFRGNIQDKYVKPEDGAGSSSFDDDDIPF